MGYAVSPSGDPSLARVCTSESIFSKHKVDGIEMAREKMLAVSFHSSLVLCHSNEEVTDAEGDQHWGWWSPTVRVLA